LGRCARRPPPVIEGYLEVCVSRTAFIVVMLNR
jgi:hypothetical protein